MTCEDEIINTSEVTLKISFDKSEIYEEDHCHFHNITLVIVCLFLLVVISIDCYYYYKKIILVKK